MARKDDRRIGACRRAAALRKAGPGVDAVLVTRVEDVTYLSGFTGDDSWLVVGPGWASLLTDGRYDEQARLECPGVEIFVRKDAMSKAVREVLKNRRPRVRRLGVQGDVMTLAARGVIEKALPQVRLVSVTNLAGDLRAIKDADEIRTICRAIAVAEAAFAALVAKGRKWFIGRTERQVAAELEYLMRLHGADKPAFETIVCAGSHASRPHYRPDDTVIKPDQEVLIDWGAMVGGYCSDLTRVVFTGKIPPKIAEIYRTVAAAQRNAIRFIRSGVRYNRVDRAARETIKAAGYEKEFIHGLGHGIGLQIHELPGLGRLAKGCLRAGMIVTIEPGIYLPGIGGVRIEDDVLVTKTGKKVLTRAAKSLSRMKLK